MTGNNSQAVAQATASAPVAVVCGGRSSERDISLLSGAAVLQGLRDAGIDAVGLDAADQLVEHLQALRPSSVFIALHGPGGEDGVLQGALEWLGLPYTGSGVLASALAMDKVRCKQLWAGMGLPTAPFALLHEHSDWQQVLSELGGVAMVKPSREGSSIGMARASSPRELEDAWRAAARLDSSVLAERWLQGAEYTVAIVNGSALPVIRLETDREFYDFEAKYVASDTRYLCPCGLSVEGEQAIQNLALQAFASVGGEGWGRVDIMADGDGALYLLEVNTVPGMTSHSLVPMAAQAAGLSFNELVVQILGSARLQAGSVSTGGTGSTAAQVSP